MLLRTREDDYHHLKEFLKEELILDIRWGLILASPKLAPIVSGLIFQDTLDKLWDKWNRGEYQVFLDLLEGGFGPLEGPFSVKYTNINGNYSGCVSVARGMNGWPRSAFSMAKTTL